MGLSALQIEVLAGGDPLRRERLIRDLHEHLLADERLSATGVTIAPAPPPPARPSQKVTVETIAMAVDLNPNHRLPAVFTELAQAI